MERRGIQPTAGDLWRDAYGRLEQVREVVSGLCERFAETYARVREVAEALRGADFSTLEAAHEQVRERDREADRTLENERDISRDRDDGVSL